MTLGADSAVAFSAVFLDILRIDLRVITISHNGLVKFEKEVKRGSLNPALSQRQLYVRLV